ncbi:MAG: hypothetical protein ACQET0_04370 [Pseudomonadota bacterium]
MTLNASDFQLLAGLLQFHDMTPDRVRRPLIAPALCAARSIATAPGPHSETLRSPAGASIGAWPHNARVARRTGHE